MKHPRHIEHIEKAVQVMERPSGCKHHWVINTPAGPISTGTCKLCAEKREFKNYLESPYWEDRVPLEQVSSGANFQSSPDSPQENPEE